MGCPEGHEGAGMNRPGWEGGLVMAWESHGPTSLPGWNKACQVLGE